MPTDAEEKKQIEKLAEEKKKEAPWWQRLSPLVLGGGGLVGFLIIRNMMTDVENRNTYIFWLIGLLVVLYLLAQTPKGKEEEIITPKEAELLTERECERKRRWEQFEPMSTYKIGPVSNLQHRDGGGVYYDVAVEVTSPYNRSMYYIGKVMAKGIEKGFVTIQEAMGPLTGREKVAEKTIVPEWFRMAERSPLYEKLILRGKGE